MSKISRESPWASRMPTDVYFAKVLQRSTSVQCRCAEERPAADQTPFNKPWSNFGQMRQFFEQIRERVGETRYFEELGLAGVNNPAEFRSVNKALECYARLVAIAVLPEVA